MSLCFKCNLEVGAGVVSLKCVDCALVFHPACTRVGSEQNLTKMKIKSWKCDSCKSEVVSVNSNEEVSGVSRTILDALQTLKMEINANTDKNITEVRGSLNSLANELKLMSGRLQTVESNQEDLKNKCVQLERDRDEMREELGELRMKLHDAEQHSRCSNIEVLGLPVTKGEDVYEILTCIAKTLGLEFNQTDISIAHRLRLFSKKHVHPPIIAQFSLRSVKETWMAAARKKKGFDAQEVSPQLPESPVYINDHLTPHNKVLLGRARRLQRDGKIYHATFVNGKVLVKPKEGDNSIRVLVVEDLDKYK